MALAGEPGIGKTRLSARVAAHAHADGAVVLYGRADEESVSPYQPFVEALRQYAAPRPRLLEETRLPSATAAELASLIPELGAPPSADTRRDGRSRERSRHELFDAVIRLLLHGAETQRHHEDAEHGKGRNDFLGNMALGVAQADAERGEDDASLDRPEDASERRTRHARLL